MKRRSLEQTKGVEITKKSKIIENFDPKLLIYIEGNIVVAKKLARTLFRHTIIDYNILMFYRPPLDSNSRSTSNNLDATNNLPQCHHLVDEMWYDAVYYYYYE